MARPQNAYRACATPKLQAQRTGVGGLEVVDELRQVLDGVDVVVRRRRDEAHARRRVARALRQSKGLTSYKRAAGPKHDITNVPLAKSIHITYNHYQTDMHAKHVSKCPKCHCVTCPDTMRWATSTLQYCAHRKDEDLLDRFNFKAPLARGAPRCRPGPSCRAARRHH